MALSDVAVVICPACFQGIPRSCLLALLPDTAPKVGSWQRALPPVSPPGCLQVVPKVQGSIPKRDKKKKKEPMGVGESFAFLAKNPYIRDLAFLVRAALGCSRPLSLPARSAAQPVGTRLVAAAQRHTHAYTITITTTTPVAVQVVAYGISINLVEVTWKSKIKAQFPNPNDYSAFMGDFSTATGEGDNQGPAGQRGWTARLGRRLLACGAQPERTARAVPCALVRHTLP